MVHDARELEAGARIHADVCIVGAGAAGITLALELGGSPLRVVLLESGGRTFDRRIQRLHAGRNVGRATHSPYSSRIRQLGGSTTQWSGMCRPLERGDFERRDGVPHSGWPFGFDELEPFYRRAQEICRLGPYDYTPARWASEEGRPLLPLDGAPLEHRIYQFSHPLDFGEVYGSELSSLENVDTYLHATALEVEVDPEGRAVQGVLAASEPGRRFRVVADRVVLAAGGLENPRLLLASNRVVPQGLGNRRDLVGRFFNDHPFLFPGHYRPPNGPAEGTLHVIEDYARMGGEQRALAAFSLSGEVSRREGLNGCTVFLLRRPAHKAMPPYSAPGRTAFNRLVELAAGRDVPDGRMLGDVGRALSGLPGIARSLGAQAVHRIRPRSVLALRAAVETTPDPSSRVVLGPDRDRFGMRRIRVDWRIDPDDLRGLDRTLEVMREEFARLDLGEIVLDDGRGPDGWPHSTTGGKHHMCTTRMAAEPSRGVVDARCRVHGLRGLSIAGSSVFSTGGVANPTLTIVALAVRLADDLKAAAGAAGRP